MQKNPLILEKNQKMRRNDNVYKIMQNSDIPSKTKRKPHKNFTPHVRIFDKLINKQHQYNTI